MCGGSDGEDTDDASTTNEGNASTTEGDDDDNEDTSTVQGPEEKPSPRETATGSPSGTKNKQCQAKVAKVKAMQAKAEKTKVADTKSTSKDTKSTLSWYVSKHASFQSRATHLKATTTLYSDPSEEANV